MPLIGMWWTRGKLRIVGRWIHRSGRRIPWIHCSWHPERFEEIRCLTDLNISPIRQVFTGRIEASRCCRRHRDVCRRLFSFIQIQIVHRVDRWSRRRQTKGTLLSLLVDNNNNNNNNNKNTSVIVCNAQKKYAKRSACMLENEQRTTARRVITEEESESERAREEKVRELEGDRPTDRSAICCLFLPVDDDDGDEDDILDVLNNFSLLPLVLLLLLLVSYLFRCRSVTSIWSFFPPLSFFHASNLDENFQIITLLRVLHRRQEHTHVYIYAYLQGYSSMGCNGGQKGVTVFNSYLFWLSNLSRSSPAMTSMVATCDVCLFIFFLNTNRRRRCCS